MKILTVKEVSEKLRVAIPTLYGWVHKKKISYIKLGGRLCFLEEHIDRFVNDNTIMPDAM